MSNFDFTTIDGERVEKRVAADFEKMAAAFKAQFGLELLITSGVRTAEEQWKLYNAYISGNGNQASKPNGSRHQIESSIGPRALDLRDSGKDKGVQWMGTVRSNWLRKNAPRFNFRCTGAFFKNPESWHYEWTGVFESTVTPPPAQKPSQPAVASDARPNKYGLKEMRGLQKVGNLWTDGKKTAIDNVWGDRSQGGFDDFLRKNYGGTKDAALAAWLRKKWGYKGDDNYGPNMQAALIRANDANFKALD